MNATVRTPYPVSNKIKNKLSTDNEFILVLNNFKSAKKCINFSKYDYLNTSLKVILDGLFSLNRLQEPYIKKTVTRSTFDNTNIIKTLEIRLNETHLYEALTNTNDMKCKKQALNKLYTIFHWKNRLISKGKPAETSRYPYRRVVAIGDIHGDYDKLLNILRHAKLINRNNDWIARDTALVQIGDLIDRGMDIQKILDLLIKLQVQAKKRKSAIHLLLGNHEIYNLRGNYYFTSTSDINTFDGLKNREEAFSPTGKYGKILRKDMKMAVVLNDSVFVHAGLTPEFAEMGIAQMNKHVQDILINTPSFDELLQIGKNNKTHPLYTDPILSDIGPTSDCIFVEKDDNILCPVVEKTLEITNSKRMVVGHNVQDYGEIKSRCNNKIIYIDLGLSSCLGNYFGYLEILNDRNEVWAVYNN